MEEEEEEWKNEGVLRERQSETGRERWGLWSVSLFGRHCFGLGRCGSLKRSHIPTWRHFRHSETGRDAHACVSMHSVRHVRRACTHMFTQTVISDCWLPQRWLHACWCEHVQAGMVRMANKECFVPSRLIHFM